MVTTHLKESAQGLVQAAHVEDGWITPLSIALEEVDAEMAAWKPAPDVACIWEIVAHAAGYEQDLLDNLEGRS